MTRFLPTVLFQKAVILTVFMLATFSAGAQQASASQSADALFAESRWDQAAHAYADITANDPANGPRGSIWASATSNCGASTMRSRLSSTPWRPSSTAR